MTDIDALIARLRKHAKRMSVLGRHIWSAADTEAAAALSTLQARVVVLEGHTLYLADRLLRTGEAEYQAMKRANAAEAQIEELTDKVEGLEADFEARQEKPYT